MQQLICIEIPFGCDFLIQISFFTWVIGNKSIKYFEKLITTPYLQCFQDNHIKFEKYSSCM